MEVWTVIKILNWTIDFFKRKRLTNPKFDAEFLISHAIGLNRLELYLNFDMPVEESEREKIKSFILRRANHEPLQYIVGETEFYGYKIQVDSSVLIPRPETERLVEIILKDENPKTILEIGTGSGAIAIALAKNLPDSGIIATDISSEALKTAKKNIEYHNLKNITLIKSDLFNSVEGKFDIIVSNPPYISKEEYNNLDIEIKNYEPKEALLAESEGIFFYEKILEKSKKHLMENGKIFFEIGYNQAKKIELIAKKMGFTNVVIKKDYNDYDRYIIIW